MKKNDIIEVTIDSVTAQGSGVGRVGEMAVFVPAAAPGDTLRAVVIKAKPRYAVAKLLEVLSPSPDRAENDCAVYPQCGGCVFRHLDYAAETQIKYNAVRDAFLRIGGMDIMPAPILAAPQTQRYRNKAQYPFVKTPQGIRLGFYAAHSHRVVPCADCLLQPAKFARIADIVCLWAETYGISVYDETQHSGTLRHLYLRKAEKSGEIMVCLVANADTLPHTAELVRALRREVPAVSGVLLNVNRADTNVILGERCETLWGADSVTDELCGLSFRLSPHSFYQVNRAQAQRLYETAAQYAGDGGGTLLDLYCGTGTIGLSMAARFEKVIGADNVPQAIADATENARANGIENAEFLCADAAEAAKTLQERGIAPRVILIDPPRKGCSAELLDIMAQLQPERIVYVSCDPATLARDCAVLQEKGYNAEQVTPVDLFPRTGHVESCVLLTNDGRNSR